MVCWWSLIFSSAILIAILFVMLQQLLLFCCLKQDCKSNISLSLYIVGLGFFVNLLNPLVYLSTHYPNHTLLCCITIVKLRILIEAITIIYGSKLYHKWFIHFLKNMYQRIQSDLPTIYHKLLTIISALISITAFIFYAFAFFNLLHKTPWFWIRCYYIIFCCFSCIVALLICRFYIKTMDLLNSISLEKISDDKIEKIKTTKNALRITLIIDILWIICSFGSVLISLDIILGVTKKYFTVNISLMTNISISVFMIMLLIPLLLWIFQKCVCYPCVCKQHSKNHAEKKSLIEYESQTSDILDTTFISDTTLISTTNGSVSTTNSEINDTRANLHSHISSAQQGIVCVIKEIQ